MNIYIYIYIYSGVLAALVQIVGLKYVRGKMRELVSVVSRLLRAPIQSSPQRRAPARTSAAPTHQRRLADASAAPMTTEEASSNSIITVLNYRLWLLARIRFILLFNSAIYRLEA